MLKISHALETDLALLAETFSLLFFRDTKYPLRVMKSFHEQKLFHQILSGFHKILIK